MNLPLVLAFSRAIAICRRKMPSMWTDTMWLAPLLTGMFFDVASSRLAAQPSASRVVMALANEPDTKALIGGTFASLNGQPRQNLGRLNFDGTLDPDFVPSTQGWVYSVVVNWDEKILVGGYFPEPNSGWRFNLRRLNPNGTRDSSFGVNAHYIQSTPGNLQGVVSAVVIQPDGKILIGGGFDKLAGWPRRNLGRVNPDGTVDPAFNPTVKGGMLPFVSSMALQPDGKILIGGDFKWLAGRPCTNIGRLNADGTLDSSFRAKANKVVRAVCLQPDGKVLLGGMFTVVNGRQRPFLARLFPNGDVDTGFNASIDAPPPIFSVNGPGVYSIGLQSDGRIVVGGRFARVRGVERKHLARINPDGTLDLAFNALVSGEINTNNFFPIAPAVYGLAVQESGAIIFGGHFSRVQGATHRNLALYQPDAPATASLEVDATRQTVTWNRSGNSPDLESAIFEQSADGTNYSRLGFGTRIFGGWQIRDLTLPPDPITIRARGRTLGGVGNRSAGVVSISANL